MTRFFRTVACAAAIALIVTACGTATPASPTSPAGSPGSTDQPAPTEDTRRVELTFMNWFYQGGMQEAYDEFIAAYKDIDPRVTNVAIETQPFTRYHDVLNVKLAGSQPPDVAWIHASLQAAYIDAGRLYDLRPVIDEFFPDYDLADFTDASLGPWSRGEKLYALPFTNATNVVFYNIDLFEQAGLKTPDQMEAEGSWTWENLRTVAKQLVDQSDARYGFHFGNNIYTNGWRNLVEIWGPYGGGPWSDDGKTCRFNAPETVESTQLVWDMVYTDQSHPGPGVDVVFETGDVGMSLTRPNFAFRWKDAGFRWGAVRQPDGPKGFVPSMAQNGIAVFADSPNPDIAARFAAFTLTRDNAIRFQANTPSNRKSTFTREILTQTAPDLTPEQLEATVIRALDSKTFVMEYSHPNFGPLFTNSHQIFDGQMWRPDANVKDVLDEVCGAISGLLG